MTVGTSASISTHSTAGTDQFISTTTKMTELAANKKPSAAVTAASLPSQQCVDDDDLSSIKPSDMKEWITRALRSLRSNNHDDLSTINNNGDYSDIRKIVRSREYLSSALKIAHSLADQLSAIEEQRGYHYKHDGGGGERDEQQRITYEPYYGINKSWSRYVSITCNKAVDDQAIDHLNVLCATFIEDDDGTIKGTSLSDIGRFEMMHSLGGTFVELFSGGQIIIANGGKLQQQQQQIATRSFSPPSTTCTGDINSELLDTPPRTKDEWLRAESPDTFELESAKAIIDAIGEDDELFGNAVNSENNDVVAESTSAIDDTSGSSSLFGGSAGRTFASRSQSTSPVQKKVLRMQSDSIYDNSLRSLGLQNALCDLISNMIGSTTEDSHDNEAYQCVTDVRDDLKMMLDSPEKYLSDFDFVNASIQWESDGEKVVGGCPILFGRDAELEALKESYHRSITSECEVAQIFGPSGIGKSALCDKFAEYATARSDDGGATGCIYLSGRFDRLQQSQPFHAIGSAFDSYCTWLSTKDQSMAKEVSSALKRDIGKEIWRLAAVMPNLSSILGSEYLSQKYDSSDDDAVDAQKRLRYLLCEFVKVMSICHSEAVVLFLDDSQWMDPASAALLNQLLMMSGSAVRHHRFFFMASCRDDEMNETHPLTNMLASVDTFGIKTTMIRLKPMNKDDVNEFVSATLSLLPRITRPLANILHQRSKGSPIFVKQLMVEMSRQRYLYPSITRRRWVWEVEKIRDMKIPESVATFILNSLNRLPSEVLSALCSLSCFGTTAGIELIEALGAEVQQDLVKHLDEAVAVSVLDKRNNSYYFVHDKLQEAAYSAMNPEDRRRTHFL